jgi:hypothetical protein
VEIEEQFIKCLEAQSPPDPIKHCGYAVFLQHYKKELSRAKVGDFKPIDNSLEQFC